jgi:hypothetical protein
LCSEVYQLRIGEENSDGCFHIVDNLVEHK